MPDKDPPGWRSDSLSRFMDDAANNVRATWANVPGLMEPLRQIDEAYWHVMDNMTNPDPHFPSYFIPVAHSAFLGAVRLAASGQLSEAYKVMRGCIEASVYAFHFARDCNAAELWAKREDSPQDGKNARNAMKWGTVTGTLESEDPALGKIVGRLYGQTLAHGAHPNVDAMVSATTDTEDEEKVTHSHHYFVLPGRGEMAKTAFALSLRTTARVGVCSLCLFERVYRTRFALLGTSDVLDRLKRSL